MNRLEIELLVKPQTLSARRTLLGEQRLSMVSPRELALPVGIRPQAHSRMVFLLCFLEVLLHNLVYDVHRFVRARHGSHSLQVPLAVVGWCIGYDWLRRVGALVVQHLLLLLEAGVLALFMASNIVTYAVEAQALGTAVLPEDLRRYLRYLLVEIVQIVLLEDDVDSRVHGLEQLRIGLSALSLMQSLQVPQSIFNRLDLPLVVHQQLRLSWQVQMSVLVQLWLGLISILLAQVILVDLVQLSHDTMCHFERRIGRLLSQLDVLRLPLCVWLLMRLDKGATCPAPVQVHRQKRNQLVQEDVSTCEVPNQHGLLEWIKHHSLWDDQLVHNACVHIRFLHLLLDDGLVRLLHVDSLIDLIDLRRDGEVPLLQVA